MQVFRALGVVFGLAAAGGCRIADADHCAHRVDAEGRTEHAWCLGEHGLPYCDRCQASSDRDGCTEAPPAGECRGLELPPEGSSSSGDLSSSDGGPAACGPDGPSEPCASVDPLLPFCRDDACVPCQDELCAQGVCDPTPGGTCAPCRPDAEAGCPAETPHCGRDFECTPQCTRHEQCPASACDLVDGACIPPEGAVAWVDGNLEPVEVPRGPTQCRSSIGADWSTPVTYCDLETALADAPNVSVIRLRALASGYRGPWMLEPASGPTAERVVVLMADGDEPVSLRSSGTTDPYLLRTVPKTRLYLAGLELRGVGDLSTAVGLDCVGSASTNTRVWLDEVDLHRFESGIRAADCDVWLRRTTVHDNQEVGLELHEIDVSSPLRDATLESSVIALNGAEGILADSTNLHLGFSSVLGNGEGLDFPVNVACLGPTAGEVSGSLLLQPQVSGSTVACTADAFVIDDRSVTEDDLGADYDALDAVFSNVVTGALREPASNPITLRGLVAWTSDDPYFDLDGQARPRPDHPQVTPGANEP